MRAVVPFGKMRSRMVRLKHDRIECVCLLSETSSASGAATLDCTKCGAETLGRVKRIVDGIVSTKLHPSSGGHDGACSCEWHFAS